MVLVKNWPFSHFLILVLLGRENVFCDILEPKNATLGYKNKKFNKYKKLRFFQRGQIMVLIKNWPFFHFYILGLIGQENLLYNSLAKKTPFQAIKNKKCNKFKKLRFFSKGLTHGFALILAIFPFCFSFRPYRPGKCVLQYYRTKKYLSRLQKQKVLKVEKLRIDLRGYGPGKCV